MQKSAKRAKPKTARGDVRRRKDGFNAMQRKRGNLNSVRQELSPSSAFGTVLDIINAHRAKALVSVNVEHLLTNWEIGQIVQSATGQLADCRVVQPAAGQIVQSATAQLAPKYSVEAGRQLELARKPE